MNIDEFIEHAKEKAREHRCHADFFESDNPMNKACIKSAEDCEQLAEWLEKFKEYQQLEEQGRLIKFPCKVGSTVYYINGKFILEYEVTGFSVDITGVWLVYGEHHADENNKTYGYNFDVDKIGKTVFLTKSEAEQKLKEMESD